MRVWTYSSDLGTPDSDEAIAGLMALHAMRGEFSTFYWGSPYGGPQEVFLTIPFLAVLGTGWLAVRLPSILLHAVACLLIWRVGLRTIGARGAKVAALIFWVWPPFVLFQLTQQLSFYATNVVYGALVVLLALRIVERPDRLRVGTFGFVLGFGFFQSPQIVPVAVPVIIWTAWRSRAALRHAWVGALFACLGAAPWIAWNAQHGWLSLSQRATMRMFLSSIRRLLSPFGPEILGLRTPLSGRPLIPSVPVTNVVYGCLIVSFFVAAIRARREPRGLLFFVIAAFPFLYAIPDAAAYVGNSPRYAVVVTPLLALVVAMTASSRARAAVVILIAAAASMVSLQRMNEWKKIPPPIARPPKNMGPLLATLHRLHLYRVYADYWVAYVIDFDSLEEIIATENAGSGVEFRGNLAVPIPDAPRYKPYDTEVRLALRSGFVYFRRTLDHVLIAKTLEEHGYQAHDVGPFVVFAPPDALP